MQITLLRENVELVSTTVNTLQTTTTTTTATLFNSNNSPRLHKNQDGRINVGPIFNQRSKIFELSSICDMAKVYMFTNLLKILRIN